MIILSKQHLKKIEELVHSYSGILFSRIATKQLETKIIAQMNKLRLTKVETYLQVLESCLGRTSEMDDLVSELTVSESSFFRNPEQFQYLQNTVLPNLIKNQIRKNTPIRICSAGCAQGEEPYSIAFVVYNFIRNNPRLLVHILAGDINSQNIEHAKKAIYAKNNRLIRVADFEKQSQSKLFANSNTGKLIVNSDIQKLVQFIRLNLKNSQKLRYIAGSDVIFCRNVLIYFDEEFKHQLVEEFHNRLNPGGILFIGEGECLPASMKKFKLIKCGKSAYGYQKL